MSHSSSSLPGQEFDPARQPRRPEESLGELFGQMTRDVGTLFRKEIELAKVEAKEEAGRLGRGAAMFGGAGLAGWLALLFLSLGLAWLLDQAMNTALAFTIVGVLWVLAAVVLVSVAKKQVKSVAALPETRQTLKEDVQWAKQQKS